MPAASLQGAKLGAAILYAAADFETRPTAYDIVAASGAVAYRYPESDAQAFMA